MKLNDVVIGNSYTCKVSGRLTRVQVLRIDERTDWKGRTTNRIVCCNEATGREIICRSAQRLRG